MNPPTLSPLYDVALESLMDGDVRCLACDGLATLALVHHGRCPTTYCEGCAAKLRATVADLIASGVVITCTWCGTKPIPADAITTYPI